MVVRQVSGLQSRPSEERGRNSWEQAETALYWKNFFFLREASFAFESFQLIKSRFAREGNGNPLQLFLPGKLHGQRSLEE